MKTTNAKQERVRVGTIISEYGEILNEIYEGDKIVRPEQDEYKRTHIIGFKKKEAFVKVFVHPITALFKELPTKEYAVTMALMPFISYNDGILRYNGKIVDGKTISDVKLLAMYWVKIMRLLKELLLLSLRKIFLEKLKDHLIHMQIKQKNV